MNSFAAIILAAGLSSRMGEFKPLLTIEGKTVIDHVISLFSQCSVDVHLVVGWKSQEVLSGLEKRDIAIIENPRYRQGMFTSIQAGISRLGSSYEGFFVMPVDIPLVRPVTLRRLIEAKSAFPGHIFFPVFDKQRGHPPLIPCNLIPRIMDWKSEGGLKSFLQTQEKNAVEVIVPDANILLDMDDYTDYTAVIERSRRREIPSEKECDIILTDIGRVDPARIRHCLKVSEVAVSIGRRLTGLGTPLDLELIRASASLHDIAKGKPQHDVAGGMMLREMGFGRVADVVGVHTDLAGDYEEISLEAKIVYLADKLVMGDRLVFLEERYDPAGRPFGSSPEVVAIIGQRLLRAMKTKQEIENLLGCSLESFLS